MRQMRPEQDQGSGDGGRTAAWGTGDRPWTLVSAGPAGGMQAGGPSLSPPSADRCRGQRRLRTPPSTSLPFVARPALTLHMHPGSRHLAGAALIPLTQARGSAPCVESGALLGRNGEEQSGGSEEAAQRTLGEVQEDPCAELPEPGSRRRLRWARGGLDIRPPPHFPPARL